MLTRNDSWEPLERAPHIHLAKRPERRPSAGPARNGQPVVRPADVKRVIRSIRLVQD